MKTETKRFPHQEFMEDNKIELDTLPKMLQKRIKGFDELEADLEHTTEDDREELLNKLELLSHELAEDLEEQFEDQLENNDVEEEEPKAPEVEKKETEPDLPPAELALPITDPTSATSQDEVHHDDFLPAVSGDEDILHELYLAKQLKVSPQQLIKKGFKTKLDNRIIAIGRYALHRGKYDTCYQILLK